MVAQKKGRGAKTPAKAKSAQPADLTPEGQIADDADTNESQEENNGDVEHIEEENSETCVEEVQPAEEGATTEDTGSAEQNQEAKAEGKEEEKKNEGEKKEKIEPGKLLVENLPPSYLFDYQDKLKDFFSKHGEILSVKRGPIILTELTTTPTLSAIVEFKNKESLEKALSEEGTVLDGTAISVTLLSHAEKTVLVGVPFEASTEYIKLLFSQCGEIAHIHEFSRTKFKILRITFQDKDGVEKALKLDKELRINGFTVTVSKHKDEDEQKGHNANVHKKRQHPQQQNRTGNVNTNTLTPNRSNNTRGGSSSGVAFNARGNFRGGRGRGGFAGRGGGAFPRGGFAPVAGYMPPAPYMPRPGGGYMNDGQRPNKRLRQM